MTTLFLSVFLSFLSFSTFASSVIDLDRGHIAKSIKRTVNKAVIQEFDVVRMDMSPFESGDLHFQLICSFNTFYDYEESYLFLTHYSPFRGMKFKLTEHDCLDLFNFMKQKFEYISEEHPLEIELDFEKKEVKKVRWKSDLYKDDSVNLG